VNISDEMVVSYSEPGVLDLPGYVNVDNSARTIEFVGPMERVGLVQEPDRTQLPRR